MNFQLNFLLKLSKPKNIVKATALFCVFHPFFWLWHKEVWKYTAVLSDDFQNRDLLIKTSLAISSIASLTLHAFLICDF